MHRMGIEGASTRWARWTAGLAFLIAGGTSSIAFAAPPEETTDVAPDTVGEKVESTRTIDDVERWPLRVRAGTSSIGFYPGWPHFLAAVGTETIYLRRGWYRLGQEIELGYLEHPKVMRGPNLDTALINRFSFAKRWAIDLGLGVGASWYVYPGTTYSVGADGTFKKGGNRGFLSLRVTLPLSVSYTFERGIRLFARYEQVVMVPFWKQEAPLLGQAVVSLGVAVPLHAKKAAR